MIIKFNFIAIAMAVVLLSCNQNNKSKDLADETKSNDIELTSPPPKINESEPENFSTADSTATAGNSGNSILQSGQPAPVIDWDKKIIKTANVTLELTNYNAYNQIIHNSTKRYGAYIASEQQTEQDGKLQNNISIKVPVEQFEALMNFLPSEGVKVIDKRISTEDVTGEVVDTKSRIEAKKKVRDRYMDLLQQAKNMKDILAVQNEIDGIQEQIEAGTGRVGYLSHQAAYSTINLNYYQLMDGLKSPDESPSFFTKTKAAFKDGASIITGLILIMITFWPLVIGALFAWYFIRRISTRSVKATATGAP